jgi:hypothetical protein
MAKHKFKKGDPRPPTAGRKKGTPNKVTRDVKEWMQELVSDSGIQTVIRKKIAEGDTGSVKGFLGLLAHVVGRPKETVEVSASPDLTTLLALALEKKNAGPKEGV